MSALDELIVGFDAAVLADHQDLQAGACHRAAADGNHFPVEFDNVVKTICVVPCLEGETPDATKSS